MCTSCGTGQCMVYMQLQCHAEGFHLKSPKLYLTHPSPLTGSNWSSHCLYSFAFSAMSYTVKTCLQCSVRKWLRKYYWTDQRHLHPSWCKCSYLSRSSQYQPMIFSFFWHRGKAAYLISYQINSPPYLDQNITYTLKFFCNGPNPIKTKNISAMYFQESSFKTL